MQRESPTGVTREKIEEADMEIAEMVFNHIREPGVLILGCRIDANGDVYTRRRAQENDAPSADINTPSFDASL